MAEKKMGVIMWEKMKFLTSSLFSFLWPFIRSLLRKESKIIIAAAQSAVAQVAADPEMEGKTWSEKLSEAVTIAGEIIARESIQAGTTEIINAIQAAYTARK